jgi:hypothetical protein
MRLDAGERPCISYAIMRGTVFKSPAAPARLNRAAVDRQHGNQTPDGRPPVLAIPRGGKWGPERASVLPAFETGADARELRTSRPRQSSAGRALDI